MADHLKSECHPKFECHRPFEIQMCLVFKPPLYQTSLSIWKVKVSLVWFWNSLLSHINFTIQKLNPNFHLSSSKTNVSVFEWSDKTCYHLERDAYFEVYLKVPVS